MTHTVPYSFKSEASEMVYRLRREIEHLPTRFQMLRIADYIRQAEWDTQVADRRAKTLAKAKRKAAITRAHNADPFGFKATSELISQTSPLSGQIGSV